MSCKNIVAPSIRTNEDKMHDTRKTVHAMPIHKFNELRV